MPKKEFVIDIFNAIAGRYDKFNHLTSLGIDNLWRKKAVSCISIDSGSFDEGRNVDGGLSVDVRMANEGAPTGDGKSVDVKVKPVDEGSSMDGKEIVDKGRTIDGGLSVYDVWSVNSGEMVNDERAVDKGDFVDEGDFAESGLLTTHNGELSAKEKCKLSAKQLTKLSAKRRGKLSAKILDMACGTGDFSIAIARGLLKRYPRAEVQIVGGDISQGMLDVMREKVAREGLDGLITTQLQDGEAIGFPDGTFDYVTIAFGIRNFEHRESGLREMLRVLKPHGRLIILELSMPQAPIIRWMFKFYMFKIMPLLGKMLSKKESAFRYLPASVEAFPQKQEFMGIMNKCGFKNVTHKAMSFGVCQLYIGEKG